MTLAELLSTPIAGKDVAIIGIPSSGKTYIANKLSNPHHETIHTDSFLEAGFDGAQLIDAVFEQMADCRARQRPVIVEGCMVYHLLLEGLKNGYKPDLIINIEISRGQQREIYLRERDSKKIMWLQRFNEMSLLSFNRYIKDCPENQRPPIIEFKNNWNYATEVTD